MKRILENKLFNALLTVVIFIPTVIAILSFMLPSQNEYSVSIVTDKNEEVSFPEWETDRIARAILKINDTMEPLEALPDSMLSKHCSFSVYRKGAPICFIRCYLTTDEAVPFYVLDISGNCFSVSYDNAETLLSFPAAHYISSFSSPPSLSIKGGDDIQPVSAFWQYRAANGSMLPRNPSVAAYPTAHAMTSSTELFFSLPPYECDIELFCDGRLLDRFNSLSDIPYGMLDSSELSFKIKAKWSNRNYKGSATYEFSSYIGAPPEYTVSDPTVQSGEFFSVIAKNVSAPHKIEFYSIPEIDATPVFFLKDGVTHGIIPIKKELAAPCEYTFFFKYGNDLQSLMVQTTPRNVRDDKEIEVSLPINKKNMRHVDTLLKIIGQSSTNTSPFDFDEGLIDYAPDAQFGARLADVFYGFGHTVIPTNGLESYRLDGVVYIFPDSASIPAVADGVVAHIGKNPILGSFAVIDHGSGIMTWYCNLSELSVSVGDRISPGQTVGISGDTGYKGINGVYLITTANGVPVSPYPLQNKTSKIYRGVS